MRKIGAEQRNKKELREAEEREKIRQHELSVQRLERNIAEPIQSIDAFKVSQVIKLCPKFPSDDDMTAFRQSFEKAMLVHEFPNSVWTKLIHPHLVVKGQKVFAELSVDSCMKNERLKMVLLLVYARVPEFHHKRFRSLTKGSAESYSNFTFLLAIPFKNWLVGVEAFDDVVKMREAVKLEQFTQALPSDAHRWVIDHKPGDLTAAARGADEYAVLSKPFQAQTSNYLANSDHNAGKGKSSRTFNRGTGKKSSLLLRDTGAVQLHVSRKRFQPFEYVDTSENRLIKGVLGQAVAVLLVEILVRSDQDDGTILCSLIDELPQGLDILVGNDHMDLVPVHVGVITRSHPRKTNTENAVRSLNTEEEVVSNQEATSQMTNNVVTQLETIAQDPSIASLSLNDDVSLDLDQELPTIFD